MADNVLAVRITKFCSLQQIRECLSEILLPPCAIKELLSNSRGVLRLHFVECDLGQRIIMICKFPIPRVSRSLALLHTQPVFVAVAQTILRILITLLCGFPVPESRQLKITFGANTV
jgi:hypothetical protein